MAKGDRVVAASTGEDYEVQEVRREGETGQASGTWVIGWDVME